MCGQRQSQSGMPNLCARPSPPHHTSDHWRTSAGNRLAPFQPMCIVRRTPGELDPVDSAGMKSLVILLVRNSLVLAVWTVDGLELFGDGMMLMEASSSSLITVGVV